LGYFGKLAVLNFKRDAEGRDLFYPFGMFGRGRILTDPETATRIRRNAAVALELTMFAIMACFVWTVIAINGQLPTIYVGYTWAGLFAALAVFSVGIWFYCLKITRGMAVSDERLTFAERWLALRQIRLTTRRSRRKMILAWLAVLYAGFCVPWLLGIGTLGREGMGSMTGFFFIAAITCFVILLWMIVADRRKS
jgi:hypothetical protein